MLLSFKPVDKAALPVIAPYFAAQTNRFCDWTVGGTYMWRQFFHNRYTIAADCLLLQSRHTDGLDYFSYPLGAAPDAALSLLEEHCAETGEVLCFSTVSAADTVRLMDRYGSETQVVPQRDFFDYLYERQALATFAGRQYSPQRNHINRFEKTYPNWTYRPLTRETVPAVEGFLEAFLHQKAAEEPLSPMEQADADGSRELLSLMHELGMQGGLIEVEGEIAAFCIGETQGDTLYVHVEKGNTRFQGVYQLLVREFAAHSDPAVRYINREDDSGDPGLRRSKLAYRPCAILEKNIVLPPAADKGKG